MSTEKTTVQTKPGKKPQTKTRGRKKVKRKLTQGVAHIQAQFNNIIVTISDTAGNVLGSSSAGACGFKGSRKGTPFAATVAAQTIGEKVKEFGLQELEVRVKGPGPGRESAMRALKSCGYTIKKIIDVTRIPHNGCRPRKKRRV